MANRRSFRPQEYKAWQQVWGMYAVMSSAAPYLKDRMRSVPTLWRDYRMVNTVMERIYNLILTTVPIEDYEGIETHLATTRCEVTKTAPNKMFAPKNYTYVPTDSLSQLLKRVSHWECITCTKCGKDAKKCPIRKEFNSLIPYEWEKEKGNDQCPYSEIEKDFVDEGGE